LYKPVFMQSVISELEHLISEFAQKFSKIPDEEFMAKPNPSKWSKQEVLGHLIDSAHNNLRRFIVGQYAETTKIIYEQDFWNKAGDYQNDMKGNVITLWVMLNQKICTVLKNMPKEKYNNLVDTGKEDVSPKTLTWLAEDYVKHMKHHFNQIIV